MAGTPVKVETADDRCLTTLAGVVVSPKHVSRDADIDARAGDPVAMDERLLRRAESACDEWFAAGKV
jgi:hypothetical protein